MNRKIKLGIIGLGKIAQTAHFPALERLEDKFEIKAIADISKELVDYMGRKHGINERYYDANELIEKADVDAALFLCGGKTSQLGTVTAAKKGLHVLIEKPMCVSSSMAERIIAAKKEGGAKVMVGYMRSYAPAYVQAAKEMESLGKINYVKLSEFMGGGEFMPKSGFVRFGSVSEELRKAEGEFGAAQYDEEFWHGEIPSDGVQQVAGILYGLSIHALSAMRGLIGMPDKVISVRLWNNLFMSIIFDYGSFLAHYEMGVDKQRRFDSNIGVYGMDKTLTVTYDTPYISGRSTTLTVGRTVDKGYGKEVIRPTDKSDFYFELESFYDCIVNNIEPKTGPEIAMRDIELFKMIVERAKIDMA